MKVFTKKHPTDDKTEPLPEETSSFAILTKPFAGLLDRLQNFSDWHQAGRAVALYLRLQRRLKKGKGDQESTVSKTPQGQKGAANLEPVSIEEQSLAEIKILKATQKEAFQRRACVPSRHQIKPGKREMQLQEGTYEKRESNPTSRSLYVS